ncbi:MAG: arsenate reductase (glutaredoxin) [Woeseia sp.]
MNIIIYHNPRCSKSRKTLELIRGNGIEPRIIEYLEDPPDAATTSRLAALLGVPVSGLLRSSETDFTEARDLPPLDDNAALARWIEKHPIVLQRPIVVDADRDQAVIGRPPERVLELL